MPTKLEIRQIELNKRFAARQKKGKKVGIHIINSETVNLRKLFLIADGFRTSRNKRKKI